MNVKWEICLGEEGTHPPEGWGGDLLPLNLLLIIRRQNGDGNDLPNLIRILRYQWDIKRGKSPPTVILAAPGVLDKTSPLINVGSPSLGKCA